MINKCLIFFVLSAFVSGCGYLGIKKWGHPLPSQKKEQSKSPGAAEKKAPPKPVDTAAQQRLYDIGMKCYTEEKYEEAKRNWQKAIQMGPATPVASKAKENLKKTEQILKTLKEIESK